MNSDHTLDHEIEYLRTNLQDSEFAVSLVRWHEEGRALSTKQRYWVHRLATPIPEAPKRQCVPYAPIMSLTPLRVMCGALTLRASMPMNGNQVVYLVVDNNYAGKITPDDVFSPTPEAPARLGDTLRDLSANPERIIAEYGRKTGRCGLCGKTLTHPESLERGVGPVCLTRF